MAKRAKKWSCAKILNFDTALNSYIIASIFRFPANFKLQNPRFPSNSKDKKLDFPPI